MTPLQRSFAREYVLNGGNGRTAAIAAGYAEGGADTAMRKCLLSRWVNDEIRRLSIIDMQAKLPEMIAVLVEIAKDPKQDGRARVQAVNSFLDRAGAISQRGAPSVAVQVNVHGGAAQGLISEIWNDRQARERALLGNVIEIAADMAVIDDTMTDTEAGDDEPEQDGFTAADDQEAGGEAAGGSRPPSVS